MLLRINKPMQFSYPKQNNHSLQNTMTADIKQYSTYSKDSYNYVNLQGGKYNITDHSFLDRYDEAIQQGQMFHLAERIDPYQSMVRSDIDNKVAVKAGTEPYPLFEEKDILKYVEGVFDFMKKYSTQGIDEADLECIVLKKQPYIKQDDKNSEIFWNKHGVHLQFPRIFMNKEDNRIMSKYMNQKYDEYDYQAGFSNAWLLYGSCKNETSGSYIPEYIVDSNLDTKPFEYEGNLTRYLSIKRNKERLMYWKSIDYKEPMKVKESNIKPIFIDDEETEVIYDIVQNWLIENDLDESLEIGEWSLGKPFLNLEKIGDYDCPLNPSYLHTGRGGYVLYKENGDLLFSCHRKECAKECGCKHIRIGNIPKEQVEIDDDILDLDCKSASMIYSQKTSGSKAYLNGLSYGELCKQDIKYARWLISSNIFPHDKHCCNVLKEHYFPPAIKLDNINPSEIIDTNNVGSYKDRLSKAHTVFLRSNMMTHKTQNLKSLMDNYKSILYVTFRVSLAEEIEQQFCEYGFETYSDLQGEIYKPRVIIQIDSLPRIRRKYDLIILDEVVYTLDHMVNFCKEKTAITKCLGQLIDNSKNMIVCDALLDNGSIEYIRSFGKSYHIVENEYKPFSHKKVRFNDTIMPKNQAQFLLDLKEKFLPNHKKIFIPTNSQNLAQKVYDYFSNDYKVLLIDRDTEVIPPSNTWIDYDIVVCTPTICAGISCNDEFDKTIAFYSNLSANAEMSAQQLLRVRNTKSDTINIYICESNVNSIPLSREDIKEVLNTNINIDSMLGLTPEDTSRANKLYKSLDKDYCNGVLTEDSYFDLVVDKIKQNNLSKVCFKRKLQGILEAHGFDCRDDNEQEIVASEETKGKCIEIKQITKDISITREHNAMEKVIKCPVINDDDYDKINSKMRKTADDKIKLRKKMLTKTYGTKLNQIEMGDVSISDILIWITLEDCQKAYKNINLMNLEKQTEFIKLKVNEKEQLSHIDILHDKNRHAKMYMVLESLKACKFGDPFTNQEIESLPYDNMLEFLKKNNRIISTMYGKLDKYDFEDVYFEFDQEGLNKDEIKQKKKEVTKFKQRILQRFNTRIKDMFGVTIGRTGDTHGNKYTLKGDVLDIISQIGIDRNTYFDEDISNYRKVCRVLIAQDFQPVGDLICV